MLLNRAIMSGVQCPVIWVRIVSAVFDHSVFIRLIISSTTYLCPESEISLYQWSLFCCLVWFIISMFSPV